MRIRIGLAIASTVIVVLLATPAYAKTVQLPGTGVTVSVPAAWQLAKAVPQSDQSFSAKLKGAHHSPYLLNVTLRSGETLPASAEDLSNELRPKLAPGAQAGLRVAPVSLSADALSYRASWVFDAGKHKKKLRTEVVLVQTKAGIVVVETVTDASKQGVTASDRVLDTVVVG